MSLRFGVKLAIIMILFSVEDQRTYIHTRTYVLQSAYQDLKRDKKQLTKRMTWRDKDRPLILAQELELSFGKQIPRKLAKIRVVSKESFDSVYGIL